MTKKFTSRFLPLVLLCSFAFANEGSETEQRIKANQRVSIYLHPFSAIASVVSEGDLLMLYLTTEYPFSGFNSLIINPSLWKSNDLFRIGSGVGLRHFFNGEAYGFYLQLMPSVYLLNYKASRGPIADVLGYIGYSGKHSGVSIFFDLGLGYRLPFFNIDFDDDALIQLDQFLFKGFAFDINVGIGIPF
jgi:hypothetical protein